MLTPSSPQIQYKIERCPCDNLYNLEFTLNKMSSEGWELYSLYEVEIEDHLEYNCIFIRDLSLNNTNNLTGDNQDDYDYLGFKTKMERIINANEDPYESCIEIQRKIKQSRERIHQIKELIESENIDQNRNELNNDLSKTIKQLSELKNRLKEIISPDFVTNILGEEKLLISLSDELIKYVDPDLQVNLVSKVVKLRQKLAKDLGYIIPKVKFELDENLASGEFIIKVRSVPVVNAIVHPDHTVFLRDKLNLTRYPDKSIKTEDPITNEKIIWINQEKTKDFWIQGKSCEDYIIDILEKICIKYVDTIMDYSDINRYIEAVSANNLYLIENIIPEFLTIGELKYLFSSLIREFVSIKDIINVFEKLNDLADEHNKENILENLRCIMNRQVSYSLAIENTNEIDAYEFSDESIKCFIENLNRDEKVVKVDSIKLEKLVKKLILLKKEANLENKKLIIAVPMQIRHIVFLTLSRFFYDIYIVSKEQIAFDYNLNIIGRV